MSAEDLGKRLLAEVEVVGVEEILNALRLHENSRAASTFGFAPLDDLLQHVAEARGKPTTTPIIELMSTQPAVGKTHLLYHLTANAVLPKTAGGRRSCVVIIDTDARFSVPRLAVHLRKLAKEHDQALSDDDLEYLLRHVHVLHTQSLSSTIAAVQNLPKYLFNRTKHCSIDRPIAFIALDSASVFYWQSRADSDYATLLQKTSELADLAHRDSTGYAQLAAALKSCTKTLNCPLIYTSWHQGRTQETALFGSDSQNFRSSLPSPWPMLPDLRLVVRRVPVRKFPEDMTVEEALRDAPMRQKVVEEGRVEFFVTMPKEHEGQGFQVAIGVDGVLQLL